MAPPTSTRIAARLKRVWERSLPVNVPSCVQPRAPRADAGGCGARRRPQGCTKRLSCATAAPTIWARCVPPACWGCGGQGAALHSHSHSRAQHNAAQHHWPQYDSAAFSSTLCCALRAVLCCAALRCSAVVVLRCAVVLRCVVVLRCAALRCSAVLCCAAL